MSHFISNILIGFGNFPFFAMIFTLPILIVPIVRYKKVNIVRIGVNYMFLLYMLCLMSLVFLPLPDAAKAAALTGHDIQLTPFRFVYDIIRESPFVWNQPSTYVAALFDDAVLQVVFNVIMMIPFGMFLRYYFKCTAEKVLGYTILLSLFIEVAQLTGLFFLFNGSYRLCDVDNLMMNTMGGYMGYRLMLRLSYVIPKIQTFDHRLVLPGRRTVHNSNF